MKHGHYFVSLSGATDSDVRDTAGGKSGTAPGKTEEIFALPVETNTTSFVLFICPVSLFLAFIAIVFSLSQRNFAFIFSKTELS